MMPLAAPAFFRTPSWHEMSAGAAITLVDSSSPAYLFGLRVRGGRTNMLYAILCYDDEKVVGSFSKEEDDALMGRLTAVQQKLAVRGRLGPVARLKDTKSARTLRKGRDMLLIDGPFAETKEQLLGFYIVDCDSEEEVIETAKELAVAASHGTGSYEIRPVSLLRPGSA
jgi:hypothetical protein